VITPPLLAELLRRDVQVLAQGEDLTLRARKGIVTHALREQVRAQKAALLAALTPGAKYARMSSAQQRLWFLHLLDPASAAYNMPAAAMRLHGPLNRAALEAALDALVARHESLRTVFQSITDQPAQVVLPGVPVVWSRLDLSALPDDARDQTLQAEVKAAAETNFDLEAGPLFRAILLTLAPEEHVLLLPMHHIISDGWSLALLFRELAALYAGAIDPAHAPTLEPLTHHYADYANLEQAWFHTDEYRTEVNYWRAQLSGRLPVLQLPMDRPRPAFATTRGGIVQRWIDPALLAALKHLGQAEHATLFMTLLAAYYAFLHRYTGQTEFIVGTPVNGRTRPETRGMFGLFVNSVPMRCTVEGADTVRDLLARVRQRVLDAFEHQQLPFERLVEELQPERDTSHAPVFQTMCVLQNIPKPSQQFGDLHMERLESHSGAVKLDLVMSLMERYSGPVLAMEYNADLFDAATIERMLDHFERLLHAAAAAPDTPVAQLDLLPPSERELLLHTFNPAPTLYPRDATAHALFEAQAERAPDAPALISDAGTIPYAQLNARANQLAHFLLARGVEPGATVAMFLEKSPDAIVAILAVLKAGAIYLPLDTTHPEARIQFMLHEAQPAVVITQAALLDALPVFHGQTIAIDVVHADIAAQPTPNLTARTTAEQPAYIIFTSGSTGHPKGAVLAHRGLCNLVHGYMGRMCHEPGCRQLQFASYCFDASIAEIFTTLCNGAALVIAPRDAMADPESLTHILQRHQVTLATIPPSLLQLLAPESLPELRQLILAGERCPAGLAELWMPGRKVYNAYGPTETTVCATVHLCDGAYPQGPPIGHPIDNVHVYVLDTHGQLAPIGVPGELCIGGPGVAMAYLGQPALTADRFVPDPFVTGERIYRSGDLVRWRADGQLEFLGRRDNQVKVRGFRVELGEIEATLQQQPGIRQAVVVARPDPSGAQRLVAYVVPHQGAPNAAELRAFLKERLPHYMVPSLFLSLDTLPVSPSGKVDRAALPAPQALEPHTSDEPRTPTEKQLARIWCEVLALPRIGLHENFLDCGGHSLLAVQLMARVQKDFHLEAPLRWIFESPTVAALAARIEAAKSPLSEGRALAAQSTLPDVLVPLRPGTAPAVFVFSPAGGTVYPYYPLAHALGASQPVYALQDPAMEGLRPPYETIEEMAAHYVDAIKVVQPEGPYHVAGWSLGAVVAFEVAQQLRAQGEDVGLVGLIEPGKASAADKGTVRGWLRDRRASLALRISVGLSGLEATRDSLYLMLASKKSGEGKRGGGLRNLGSEAVWRLVLKRAQIGHVVSEDERLLLIKQPTSMKFMKIARVNIRAARRYKPKPYPGQVDLFRGSTLPEANDPVISDWTALAGALPVHTIEGDHFSLVRNPASTTIAQIMTERVAALDVERVKTNQGVPTAPAMDALR
jgi:amino acid adenylation domain-containing protein